MNLYTYAGHNPVSFRDPFGLCPPKDEDPCNTSTGDSNLDGPMRQILEDAYKSAPADPQHPGYVDEVGGWCVNKTQSCTTNVGGVDSVNTGTKPRGASFTYHTHGNAGKQALGRQPGDNYEAWPSDKDVRNQAGRKEPSYVFGPNTIYRMNTTKQGIQWQCFERWTGGGACPH